MIDEIAILDGVIMPENRGRKAGTKNCDTPRRQSLVNAAAAAELTVKQAASSIHRQYYGELNAIVEECEQRREQLKHLAKKISKQRRNHTH